MRESLSRRTRCDAELAGVTKDDERKVNAIGRVPSYIVYLKVGEKDRGCLLCSAVFPKV